MSIIHAKLNAKIKPKVHDTLLYLDATYLKVNWGSYVGDLALLVAIGVNEQGFREVLAVESAAGERKEAYRNLLKDLLGRGLRGMQLVVSLVVSDDHESIKSAVQAELPRVRWQPLATLHRPFRAQRTLSCTRLGYG